MKVLVTDTRNVGTEMTLFILASADGSLFSPHEAGAHIDVVTPGGCVRQYSLCGDPLDNATLSILVKRQQASRGGSESMHTLEVGHSVDIGEPRNAFPLYVDQGPYLLLSAGVGITPIVSMAHQLVHTGDEFTWHHFARSSNIRDLCEALSLDKFGEKLSINVDVDRDRMPDEIIRVIKSKSAIRRVYACGPIGFMSSVEEIVARTLSAASVHLEKFSAPLTTRESRPFSVRLATTGLVLEVSAQESLLDALKRHGVLVSSGCECGVCGMCATKVLDGDVLHMDAILTDEERSDQSLMCACVSRANGVLTLDL